MGFGFLRVVKGIQLVPKTPSTASEMGDLDVDSGTGRLVYNNGTLSDLVVTRTSTDTLTNKTLTDPTITLVSPLKFVETGGGSDFVSLSAPAALAASYALVLPVDDGTSGYVLVTDGSGNLSWAAPGSGGSIGSPVGGGTANSVLYVSTFGVLSQDPTDFNYQVSTKLLRAGNRLLIGTNDAFDNADGLFLGSSTVTTARIGVFTNSNSPPLISMTKSRGTQTSPTAVTSGAGLGRYQTVAYDGSTYQIGFALETVAGQTWSPGANGVTVNLLMNKNGVGGALPSTRTSFNADTTNRVLGSTRIAAADLDTTFAPNPCAVLQLDTGNTPQGFLPPRITTIARDAIASPVAGLIIFNTDTNVLDFYNGATWGAV